MVAPRPAHPALAEDRGGLRPREPQAGLLPLDGVPHRPVDVQQPRQPPRRAVRARGGPGAGRGPRPARRGGARRRARQRRPRPPRRLLPRLDGHPRHPRRRVRPAVRVRHLPPGGRGRPAGRAARPLAPPARPLGGRPPRGGGGRPRPVRGPGARRGPGPHPRRPDRPPRRALRPAGRRLRRPDGQHAAALGGRGDGRVRLRRVQRRRLLRRGPREGRGREPDPRPLPRRLHPRRRGAAVRPGALPRLLLARRHRPAVPETRERLEGPPRQGRHPAQRHPPRAGRRRADADPARRGRARLGRGVGPDRADPRLHQPHAPAGGPGAVAGPLLRDAGPEAAGDRLRGQPPVPRRGPRSRPATTAWFRGSA